jgi:hypothetical protein
MQLWLNKPVRRNQCSSSLYAICVGGLGADGGALPRVGIPFDVAIADFGFIGEPADFGFGRMGLVDLILARRLSVQVLVVGRAGC